MDENAHYHIVHWCVCPMKHTSVLLYTLIAPCTWALTPTVSQLSDMACIPSKFTTKSSPPSRVHSHTRFTPNSHSHSQLPMFAHSHNIGTNFARFVHNAACPNKSQSFGSLLEPSGNTLAHYDIMVGCTHVPPKMHNNGEVPCATMMKWLYNIFNFSKGIFYFAFACGALKGCNAQLERGIHMAVGCFSTYVCAQTFFLPS